MYRHPAHDRRTAKWEQFAGKKKERHNLKVQSVFNLGLHGMSQGMIDEAKQGSQPMCCRGNVH